MIRSNKIPILTIVLTTLFILAISLKNQNVKLQTPQRIGESALVQTRQEESDSRGSPFGTSNEMRKYYEEEMNKFLEKCNSPHEQQIIKEIGIIISFVAESIKCSQSVSNCPPHEIGEIEYFEDFWEKIQDDGLDSIKIVYSLIENIKENRYNLPQPIVTQSVIYVEHKLSFELIDSGDNPFDINTFLIPIDDTSLFLPESFHSLNEDKCLNPPTNSNFTSEAETAVVIIMPIDDFPTTNTQVFKAETTENIVKTIIDLEIGPGQDYSLQNHLTINGTNQNTIAYPNCSDIMVAIVKVIVDCEHYTISVEVDYLLSNFKTELIVHQINISDAEKLHFTFSNDVKFVKVYPPEMKNLNLLLLALSESNLSPIMENNMKACSLENCQYSVIQNEVPYCKSCQVGYNSELGNCLNETIGCSDGFVLNETAHACIECNQYCKKCDLDTLICTECYSNSNHTILNNGSCIDKCPLGQMSPQEDPYSCVHCEDLNCLKCDDNEANCTVCNDDELILHLHQDTGFYTCINENELPEDHYVEDGPTGPISKPCDKNCTKSCYGTATNCTECSNGTYLYEHQCVTTVPIGFFPNNNTNTLDRCPSNCLTCSNNETCLTCEIHYGLDQQRNDNKCYPICENATFVSSGTCVLCDDEHCKKCRTTNNCDECEAHYYKQVNADKVICVENCGIGNFINDGSCKQCGNLCAECNATTCFRCLPDFSLQSNDCKENCDFGFARNQTSENGNVCVPCETPNNSNNCKSCLISNLTKCDACADADYLVIRDAICVDNCPNGTYHSDPQNSNQKVCRNCMENCNKCETLQQCLECNEGFLKKADGTKCVTIEECKSENSAIQTDNNGAETCVPCPEGCSSCSHSPQKCTGCISEYYLYNDNCVKNCSDIGGFANPSESGDEASCQRCNGNTESEVQCLECTTKDKCTKCNGNLLLQDGRCVEQCDQRHGVKDEKVCLPCTNEFCLECFPNLSTCSKCPKNDDSMYYILYDGNCTNKCPDGTFKDGPQTCSPCHSTCATCEAKDQCLTCKGNLLGYPNSTCSDSCNATDGQYEDNGVCKDCPIMDCIHCVKDEGKFNPKCIKCNNNTSYLPVNNTCVEKCPLKYFMEESSRECIACKNPKCDICTPEGECKQCESSPMKLYLMNNDCFECNLPSHAVNNYTDSCQECSATCQDCKFESGIEICLKCKEPFYMAEDGQCHHNCEVNGVMQYIDKANGTCHQCKDLECANCQNDKDHCKKCKLNKVLNTDGTCDENCEVGFYDKDGNCTQCISNCESCNSHNCFKCNNLTYMNYVNEKEECRYSCPEGTRMNNLTRNCDKCTVDQCLECNNSLDTCEKCSDEMNGKSLYLKDGNCVFYCGEDYFVEKDLHKCTACEERYENCTKCNNDPICIECENSLIKEGKCVYECGEGYYANQAGSCEKCHESCKNCIAFENTSKCTECMSPQNVIRIDGICNSTCLSGSGLLSNNTCRECNPENQPKIFPEECENCDIESGKCITCKDGLLIQNERDGKQTCVSKCDPSYVLDLHEICNPCTQSECIQCEKSDHSACKLCQGNLFLDDKTCVESCNSTQFEDTRPDGIKRCKNCSSTFPNCKLCNSTMCALCETGFYLDQNNECVKQCDAGYYNDETKCSQCPENCLTCQNKTTCLTCKENFCLLDSICKEKESETYFQKNDASGQCVHHPCPQFCKTCDESGKCSNCTNDNYFYQDHKNCSTVCDKGYFPGVENGENQCYKCTIEKCADCTKDKCLSCQEPLVVSSNGTYCNETCLDGEVKSETLPHVCKPCNSTNRCLTCESNNLNQCTSCDLNLVMENGVCKENCSSGYYESNGQCLKCSSRCAECSFTDNNCTKCLPDFELVNLDNNTSNCECKDQHLEVEDMKCKKCEVEYCEECSELKNCIKCQENYIVHKDSHDVYKCIPQCTEADGVLIKDVCESCNIHIDNCIECVNSDETVKCKKCKDLLVKDNTCVEHCDNGYAYENECKPCSTWCTSCTNHTTCLSCMNDYILRDGNCTTNCEIGEYVSETQVNGQKVKTCKPCQQNCDKCKSSTECTECSSGFTFYPDNNTCVKCDQDSFYIKDKECRKCGVDNCKDCSKENNPDSECTICSEDYYLKNNDTLCVPKEDCDMHANPITFKCESCSNADCIQCRDYTDLCTHCNPDSLNKYLVNGNCKPNCPIGYSPVEENSSFMCEKCLDGNCAYCNDVTSTCQCKECKSDYFLMPNGTCSKNCTISEGYYPSYIYIPDLNRTILRCDHCHSTCNTCNGLSDKNCLTCHLNAHLTSDYQCKSCAEGSVFENDVCEKCKDPNCRQCSPSDTCISCIYPFKKADGQCVTCNETDFKSYFVQGDNCLKCDPVCLTCNGPTETSCLTCPENTFLAKNNTCVAKCPEGQVGVNGKCISCEDINCKECGENRKCKTCKDPFVLSNNTCKHECPESQYPDENKKCQPCNTSCKQCSSQNNCTACKNTLFLDHEACVPSCGAGKVPIDRICHECIEGCTECINLQTCNTCNTSYLKEEGHCVKNCTDGYFQKRRNCEKCPSTCKTCDSKDNCTTCVDENADPNKNCESCKLNHYTDKDNRCLPCNIVNCESCKNTDRTETCLKCSTYLRDGICVDQCGDGWYTDEPNKQCIKCNNGCKTCTIYENGGFQHCDSCLISSHKINEAGVCEECKDVVVGDHCKKCQVDNCLKCAEGETETCARCNIDAGYRLLDNKTCTKDCNTIPGHYSYDNFNCDNCTVEHCFDCSVLGRCKKCEEDYYLNPASYGKPAECVKECGIEMGPSDNGKCENCKSSLCANCSKDSEICELCKNDTFVLSHDHLKGYECTRCNDPGQFIHENECKSCLKDCNSCTNQTTCIDCSLNTYWLNGICVPDNCENNGYRLENINKCVPCPENCKECDEHGCTKCEHDMSELYEDGKLLGCVENCPKGSFHNTINETKICTRCDSNCADCDNHYKCNECIEHNFLKDNTTCVNPCGTGYYSNELNKTCEPCKADCSGVSSENCCAACSGGADKCDKCKEGNILEKGTTSAECVVECPDGFFSSNEECKICPATCTKCTSDTNCTECLPEFHLVGGQCISECPLSQTMKTEPNGDKNCVPCDDSQCATCRSDDTSLCLKCLNITEGKLYLKNGECVEECGEGFFHDNDKNTCERCEADLPCKACTGKDQCTECLDGTYLVVTEHENQITTSTCSNICPEHFYADCESNKCEECDSSCKTCFAGSSAYCMKCADNFYRDTVKGWCVEKCTEKYYKGYNNITHEKECKRCPIPDCKTCHEDTLGRLTCEQCQPGYRPVSDTTCQYNPTHSTNFEQNAMSLLQTKTHLFGDRFNTEDFNNLNILLYFRQLGGKGRSSIFKVYSDEIEGYKPINFDFIINEKGYCSIEFSLEGLVTEIILTDGSSQIDCRPSALKNWHFAYLNIHHSMSNKNVQVKYEIRQIKSETSILGSSVINNVDETFKFGTPKTKLQLGESEDKSSCNTLDLYNLVVDFTQAPQDVNEYSTRNKFLMVRPNICNDFNCLSCSEDNQCKECMNSWHSPDHGKCPSSFKKLVNSRDVRSVSDAAFQMDMSELIECGENSRCKGKYIVNEEYGLSGFFNFASYSAQEVYRLFNVFYSGCENPEIFVVQIMEDSIVINGQSTGEKLNLQPSEWYFIQVIKTATNFQVVVSDLSGEELAYQDFPYVETGIRNLIRDSSIRIGPSSDTYVSSVSVILGVPTQDKTERMQKALYLPEHCVSLDLDLKCKRCESGYDAKDGKCENSTKFSAKPIQKLMLTSRTEQKVYPIYDETKSTVFSFLLRSYQLATKRTSNANTILRIGDTDIIRQQGDRLLVKDAVLDIKPGMTVVYFEESEHDLIVSIAPCGSADKPRLFTFKSLDITEIQFGSKDNMYPEIQIINFVQYADKIKHSAVKGLCVEVKECANCKNGCDIFTGACKTCLSRADSQKCSPFLPGKVDSSIYGYKKCWEVKERSRFVQSMELLRDSQHVYQETYTVTGAFKKLDCPVVGKQMLRQGEYVTVFQLYNAKSLLVDRQSTLISLRWVKETDSQGAYYWHAHHSEDCVRNYRLHPQPEEFSLFGFSITVGFRKGNGKRVFKYQLYVDNKQQPSIEEEMCEGVSPVLTKDAELKLFGLCDDNTQNIIDGYVPFIYMASYEDSPEIESKFISFISDRLAKQQDFRADFMTDVHCKCGIKETKGTNICYKCEEGYILKNHACMLR